MSYLNIVFRIYFSEFIKEKLLFIFQKWSYLRLPLIFTDYVRYWIGSIHTFSSKTAPVILVFSHAENKDAKDVRITDEYLVFKNIGLWVTTTFSNIN